MHDSRLDLNSPKAGSELLKMVLKLFELWGLSRTDQCILLGISPENSTLLNAIPEGCDFLDRVGWLIGIHKSLRLLYPSNPEICYSWINRRNTAFNNLTPLDLMKQEGIIGLIRVAHYLKLYTEL